MSGENGSLTIGERLARMEGKIENINEKLDDRHRALGHKQNEFAQWKAATEVQIKAITDDISALVESQKWAFRMLASAFIGLIFQFVYMVTAR
jgi:predicted  nucleic acid-binding Zn-ribbon protein